MTIRMRIMILAFVFSAGVWSLLIAGAVMAVQEKPHDQARSNASASGEG
jgi:hypothetical protein